MRRRTLLRRASVVAALGLAGCTGGPADEPTDSPRPATASPTPSPMATGTPEPTSVSTTASGPTESPSPSASPTPSPTATAPPDREITVGPDGRLRFEPASFEIAAGDTVLWTWEAGGHNVKSSSTPDGSDWTGTPGEEFDTFGSGYTYSYTFEVAGTYEYYCAPHRSSGMTGSFTVG